MECYGESKMIKTFRGLIADGAQDTIVLHTSTGSTGYRIVKLELMTNQPHVGSTRREHIIMVWKVEKSGAELADSTTAYPDFSNNQLLGVGLATNDVGAEAYGAGLWQSTIFDNDVFNQDIYVTHREEGGSTIPCNYYIELEQVKLDLSESTVATLKDIRNERASITG